MKFDDKGKAIGEIVSNKVMYNNLYEKGQENLKRCRKQGGNKHE